MSFHLLLLADAEDYEPPGGQSVSLPSHKPLLTLRDPPGGGSHSYYQNVKTTMKLTLENYESYADIAACKCEKILSRITAILKLCLIKSKL
jgi:hypothetical protein